MADSLGLGAPLSSSSPVYTVFGEHTKGNENYTMALPGNAGSVSPGFLQILAAMKYYLVYVFLYRIIHTIRWLSQILNTLATPSH